MAIEVKHTTQAVGTDAGNGEIRKAQWNESHTLNMATNTLLGRSTAGTGAAEEISIGSGLSLDSGTLSASGGGGGASAITISNKTGAYTVVAGDLGTIINCTSGTFTVSLTAAATLGAGFNCWVWNTGTGVITIDPNGTEKIDGASTRILRRGEGMQIVCDGTNWQTGDKKTMRGYAENCDVGTAASASGSDSVAVGPYAVSSGLQAVSFGYGLASGIGSVAIGGVGTSAQASGYGSTAIGSTSGGAGSKAITGTGAMALGGSYASGSNSFAAAVANNTSSYGALGSNSIALGGLSQASGAYAFAVNGAASATYSIALNGSATAAFAAAIGLSSKSDTIGKYSYASGGFGSSADLSQIGIYVLRRATTDATATVLTTDNSAPSNNDQVILPDYSAFAFTGIVVARRQAAGGTESAAWKVEGLIRRENTAASTTLVTSTVTEISNAPGWTLALSADTTNGGLKVEATGAAATNIRWVATIQTSECSY